MGGVFRRRGLSLLHRASLSLASDGPEGPVYGERRPGEDRKGH